MAVNDDPKVISRLQGEVITSSRGLEHEIRLKLPNPE
jgi:hypothetical protein